MADFVHLIEARQGFVQGIMRCPDSFSSDNPLQIVFWYRADPLTAIFLLTTPQFRHDVIGLPFHLSISRRRKEARRSGKPVAEEVAPQLTGRRLPSPVAIRR